MKLLSFLVSSSALLPSLTSSFSVNRVFVGTPSKTDARLVADCMTHNPVTLLPSTTVDEAIQRLLKLGFNGAPVVDPESNNLVGVVSAFDFLQKEEGGALLPMQGTPQELERSFSPPARSVPQRWEIS
jgi:CBS domain-containing protein